LDKKGISYEEINVADDKKGLAEMVEKTGYRIAPVIVFGDKIVVGYDVKELDKLFERKGI
jgi:glutaredoxin